MIAAARSRSSIARIWSNCWGRSASASPLIEEFHSMHMRFLPNTAKDLSLFSARGVMICCTTNTLPALFPWFRDDRVVELCNASNLTNPCTNTMHPSTRIWGPVSSSCLIGLELVPSTNVKSKAIIEELKSSKNHLFSSSGCKMRNELQEEEKLAYLC